MKAGGKFGGEEGGPDDLRALLQHWTVSGPPLEIEEDLRRTFRHRLSRSRQGRGLATAAVLTLLLLSQVASWRRSDPPGRAESAAAPPMAAPLGSSTPAAESTAVVSRATVRSAAPVRRARPRPSGGTLVVIEPGQGELLVGFARQLRGTRQAPSGVSLPRIDLMPADAPAHEIPQAESKEELISHRTEWKRVGSDWPLLQRSL